ncbi:hypothetical protein OIO90_005796 [Microbotryomycetes sp. JL221]|nr:hypothetical protein OIO90_005796 [Microbotryomycetes sp. JL221]
MKVTAQGDCTLQCAGDLVNVDNKCACPAGSVVASPAAPTKCARMIGRYSGYMHFPSYLLDGVPQLTILDTNFQGSAVDAAAASWDVLQSKTAVAFTQQGSAAYRYQLNEGQGWNGLDGSDAYTTTWVWNGCPSSFPNSVYNSGVAPNCVNTYWYAKKCYSDQALTALCQPTPSPCVGDLKFIDSACRCSGNLSPLTGDKTGKCGCTDGNYLTSLSGVVQCRACASKFSRATKCTSTAVLECANGFSVSNDSLKCVCNSPSIVKTGGKCALPLTCSGDLVERDESLFFPDSLLTDFGGGNLNIINKDYKGTAIDNVVQLWDTLPTKPVSYTQKPNYAVSVTLNRPNPWNGRFQRQDTYTTTFNWGSCASGAGSRMYDRGDALPPCVDTYWRDMKCFDDSKLTKPCAATPTPCTGDLSLRKGFCQCPETLFQLASDRCGCIDGAYQTTVSSTRTCEPCPDNAVCWGMMFDKFVRSCNNGFSIAEDGNSCVCTGTGQEVVGGKCVASCASDQTRDSNGECVTKQECSGLQVEDGNGGCKCPSSLVESDGNCVCPDGNFIRIQGARVTCVKCPANTICSTSDSNKPVTGCANGFQLIEGANPEDSCQCQSNVVQNGQCYSGRIAKVALYYAPSTEGTSLTPPIGDIPASSEDDIYTPYTIVTYNMFSDTLNPATIIAHDKKPTGDSFSTWVRSPLESTSITFYKDVSNAGYSSFVWVSGTCDQVDSTFRRQVTTSDQFGRPLLESPECVDTFWTVEDNITDPTNSPGTKCYTDVRMTTLCAFGE